MVWFVVDTNLYAGNNAATLCAWMTGQTDEVGHGREQAASFMAAGLSLPDDFVIHERDENGFLAPASIVSTPQLPKREVMGYALEQACSVAIRLSRMPTPGEAAFLVARARSFTAWRKCSGSDPQGEILGLRIVKETRVRSSEEIVVDEEAVRVAAAKIALAEAQ